MSNVYIEPIECRRYVSKQKKSNIYIIYNTYYRLELIIYSLQPLSLLRIAQWLAHQGLNLPAEALNHQQL